MNAYNSDIDIDRYERRECLLDFKPSIDHLL